MSLSTNPRSSLVALAGVLVLAGASGCAAASAPEDDAEPLGQAAEAITGSAVVANGEQWVGAQLHYCQAAHGAVDFDSSCWAWEGPSHVCDRQSNGAWNAYRSDCSGFITWAWGLPPIGDGGYVTSQFAPFDNSFSKPIQAVNLQPGDAANLNAGGHIVLFKKWTTPGSEAVFMEEPGCSAAQPYAHEFTSSVTVNGQNIDIAYEGATFTAIRFDSLTTKVPDWGASFVAQSWPFATTTMKMTVNQVLPATITLKNIGAKTWDSKTKLGTTQPRDRSSPFHDADWLSPSRLAALPNGTTVAPGKTYEFKFSFHAPDKPGTFDEFYGVVEEGVAWFSDPSQGGPPDNDLEAKIQVDQAAYHGQFVSQTYATLQQAPIAMTVGETRTGTITLKNVGTATWKAGVTKLAPTPRDKPSPLGSAGWLAATRVSSPPADVPPGGSYAFPLELSAEITGDFTQTFSLVEEAVTWFGDAPKGGGPPDGFLAVHVVVTPAPGSGTSTGTGTGGGGAAGAASSGPGTGGGGTGGTVRGSGGKAGESSHAGSSATGASEPGAGGASVAGSDSTGGCAYRTPGAPGGSLAIVGWLSAAAAAASLRRRRRASALG